LSVRKNRGRALPTLLAATIGYPNQKFWDYSGNAPVVFSNFSPLKVSSWRGFNWFSVTAAVVAGIWLPFTGEEESAAQETEGER
jgi:hypothetical protein